MEAFNSYTFGNTNVDAEEITVGVNPLIFGLNDIAGTQKIPKISPDTYILGKNVTLTPLPLQSEYPHRPTFSGQGNESLEPVSISETTQSNSYSVAKFSYDTKRDLQSFPQPPEGLFLGQASNWEPYSSSSYQQHQQIPGETPFPQTNPTNQFNWNSLPNLHHNFPMVCAPPNNGYINVTTAQQSSPYVTGKFPPLDFQIPQEEPPKLVCKTCSKWTYSVAELCSHFTKHIVDKVLKNGESVKGLCNWLKTSNSNCQWSHMDHCMTYLRLIKPSLVPHKAYECPMCRCVYTKFAYLYRHIVAKHVNNRETFSCDICHTEFPSQTRLKTHKEKHIRHVNAEWCCRICNLHYATKYTLRKHLKRCEKNIAAAPPSSICDYTFPKSSDENYFGFP